MDYINLHTSLLDSEAIVGSEPVDRATWLYLLRYCCGQENGGVIVGARAWGDRRWQQVCRVTLAEVQRETALWTWRGDDLCVHAYPIDKQAEVQAKRAGGKAGATARWHGSANGSAIQIPDAEGKGREWKEVEGKPTTAAIPSQGKIDIKALLAAFGLPNGPQDAMEWRGGLRLIAMVGSLAEAQAFLRWAIETCDHAGARIEHFRHARQLAVEWNAGQRNNHWKAA